MPGITIEQGPAAGGAAIVAEPSAGSGPAVVAAGSEAEGGIELEAG